MGARRTKNFDLPLNMYRRKNGSYFYRRCTDNDIELGRYRSKALQKYYQLTAEDRFGRTYRRFSDLLDRYMQEIAPAKSLETFHCNLKSAADLRAFFGSMEPSLITCQHVYLYLDLKGQLARTRANRDIALLSHIFTYAIRWGVVVNNPCVGVKRHSEKPRKRYVTDEEFEVARKKAPPVISAFLEFCRLTALRPGDALSFKFSNVDWNDGLITDISKTGDRMVINWSSKIESVLEEVKALPLPYPREYLFVNRKGVPYTKSGFRKIFHRFMKSLKDNGLLAEVFCLSDIRTKAASDTNIDHAQKLLAHSNMATTKRHYMRNRVRVNPLE